jgi:hypothetical protein
MPDTHSYWLLGQHLAAGRPYEYGGPEFQVFRAPGYPLLLAGLFRILGTDAAMIWARLLGAVLGTLAVAGIMWLAQSIFAAYGPGVFARHGMAVGFAGLFAACYPGAIATSVFVLAEALFCPLMVLHLVGWVQASRSGTTRLRVVWGGAAGVAAGAAVLTRPSWLLFTPLALILVLFFGGARRHHWQIGICMIGAMCAALTPWWFRNYRAVGHFVPTTLQVGASLYDGLNPRATGGSDMWFSQAFYELQKVDDAIAGRSAKGFEVRLDQRLRSAAWAWATGHPGHVLRLMVRKFIRMWNVWPNAEEFRSWRLRLIVALGYIPLMVLGCLGLWKWRRAGWPLMLCVLPAVYYTGLHMLFVSSIRYRQPAMMVWLILSAAVVAAWWQPFGKTYESCPSGSA